MTALVRTRCGCTAGGRFQRVAVRGIGWILVASTLFAAAAGWSQSKAVDPFVYEPYSARANPRITAKWGADALPAINSLRKDAALKIAHHPDCNRVSTAELSESRSARPDAWVIVVDCDNGRRFFVTKPDLKKDSSSREERLDERPAT